MMVSSAKEAIISKLKWDNWSITGKTFFSMISIGVFGITGYFISKWIVNRLREIRLKGDQ